MRVAVPKQSLNRLLRWSQRGLAACAVAMLGYCVFVVVDTRVFQERESRNLQRLLEARDRFTRRHTQLAQLGQRAVEGRQRRDFGSGQQAELSAFVARGLQRGLDVAHVPCELHGVFQGFCC